MSAICIINLKESHCSFEELDCLSKDIIAYSSENKLAAFFNCKDYMPNLIEEAGMSNYFLVSDSFLYRNCEFLSLDYDKCQRINNIERFKRKYYFFEDIIGIIFRYDIPTVEIYVSDDGASEIKDFETIHSSVKTIVSDLYNNVFGDDKHVNYFHAEKYVINKE